MKSRAAAAAAAVEASAEALQVFFSFSHVMVRRDNFQNADMFSVNILGEN